MERQGRVVQQSAMGPVIVGVSVEQEIDDIDAQQQEQLANAAIAHSAPPSSNSTVGSTLYSEVKNSFSTTRRAIASPPSSNASGARKWLKRGE